VFVQVPLARRMEAEECLPTGKLLPVSGTAHDLRRSTALTGLALDDVYFGMFPGKAAAFELRDRGLRVTLSGSAAFTHLVIYTPPGRPFFCIENQTSSTDAHNLDQAGARKVAHLQVIAPGKRAAGHIDWTIRRIPPPSSTRPRP
jgi:aldose 1-epimerase